jgi:recombination associated protein RdgC
MFKNLILYRLGDTQWQFDDLVAGLAGAQFAECLPTQEKSCGWIPPRGEEHGALAEAIAGQVILRFKSEVRVLPGAVVRRKAEERLASIEQITGRKPGKKQAREIREDTYMQLLPQAFTRQESILVWLAPASRLLAIDTGSRTKAEEVLTCLFKSAPGLTAAPIATASSPAAGMASWLSGISLPSELDVDRDLELKAKDDSGAAVRYTQHHLDVAEVRAHVAAGKMPTRLAMGFEGRIAFTLTDTLQLKKIRFLDGVMAADIEEADRFDSDTLIATTEMLRVIYRLIEVLGGHDDPVPESAEPAPF